MNNKDIVVHRKVHAYTTSNYVLALALGAFSNLLERD
jgi:hypothetical protein